MWSHKFSTVSPISACTELIKNTDLHDPKCDTRLAPPQVLKQSHHGSSYPANTTHTNIVRGTAPDARSGASGLYYDRSINFASSFSSQNFLLSFKSSFFISSVPPPFSSTGQGQMNTYNKEVYMHLRGERASGEPFRKNYPQYTRPESNHDFPVIGILVYCESDALDHVATEAGQAYTPVFELKSSEGGKGQLLSALAHGRGPSVLWRGEKARNPSSREWAMSHYEFRRRGMKPDKVTSTLR
uniref:Uncharacterized protein n=1 Tax=Timema shepardi TaxID=629360 RepID=A0A7R9FVP1_TIMSH|nr:unnamed protein product [Timema shepardi]